MSRKLQDSFFKKAKAEGYLARSAYKLLEIQQKYSVIAPGASVLDLGCSPGAWLQVIAKLTSGHALGVDLQECPLPAGLDSRRFTILRADARQLKKDDLSGVCQGFDTVLSDMCHPTIGNAAADAARSMDLATIATNLALGLEEGALAANLEGVLLPKGNFVVKVLEGSGVSELAQRMRASFSTMRYVRPQATRRESREIYLVGLARKA